MSIDKATIRTTERTLKAMANSRRLTILGLLANTKEMTVSEIAEKSPMPFATASQHLRILETRDIIECRRDTNLIYYRIDTTSPVVKSVIAQLFRKHTQ